MTTLIEQLKSRFLSTQGKLLLFSMAGFAAADQPVHCIKNSIVGTWTFQVTKESKLPPLDSTESVCTHELPNKLQIIEPSHDFFFEDDQYYQIEATLNSDYSCEATIVDTKINKQQCSWTMMYDQAYVIYLPDLELLGNFRYEVKPGQEESWKSLTTGDYGKFSSVCDATMVGLARNTKTKKFSCTVGEQIEALKPNSVNDNQNSASTVVGPQTSFAQTSSSFAPPNSMSFAQTSANFVLPSEAQPAQFAQTQSRMSSLHDVSEDQRIQLAQLINEQDLPWKANAYTQVDVERFENPVMGMPPSFNFAQVQNQAFGSGSDWDGVLQRAQKYIKNGNSLSDDELKELKHFDWSDFEGYDFTGPMRDQKACGSCFLIATNTMLESRIKLWYGEETSLSSQFPLQCNFMTEGCHGGWGLFYSMFLESYYTVDEKEAMYTAKTTKDGCRQFKDFDKKKVASVEETYYVGGAYGTMTEKSLMKEVRCKGPVLYDFNAGGDFMTYQSGILMEKQLPHGIKSQSQIKDNTINDVSQDKMGVEYQKLTHSTLIVGWGEEEYNGETIKYWKVRNSYGGYWGENGYFRVRRGNNDYGGEGENSTHVPICHTCKSKRADK